MFNKSQLFFIYKTKSVNLFQEMTGMSEMGLMSKMAESAYGSSNTI